ncbi:mechanosensitive ion channel [Pandoraea nosoerga]|uniref:mechanosensitive ion channel family protein n=1 Tax=Pandoraea nosoerga TaxID=2508296 RepID=UPI00197EA5F0|nr:mechanosensitive ion channel domain-containing protein [Pandoraea nosoerga]MBN4664191.1 mechanosensitive ion channel [Pandoraea nosoerga]MBN4675400.1 mechanosensitive ion channel [Pandoraea nosoerga]MBN4679278.1 mechanosensitive ion channel [Pandoraea nosoerga]MBN4743724.1 mechanosensitive ion channel [Pandoraea nosoerga]
MTWEAISAWFDGAPWARLAGALAILVLTALLVQTIAQFLIVRVVRIVVQRTANRWDDALLAHRVFHRAAHVLPYLVIQFGIGLVPDLPPKAVLVIGNVALATTLLYATLALVGILDAAQTVYAQSEHARTRSIKGYVQLGKIALYVVAAIAIVATIIDRSPWLLLSGLGAMSAVLLLVFKDTIMSFVASVQLTSNDMLRVGDWIEMPQVGADGDVVDIALHTVKVQNWDKTITTIPTWRMISESFRNWRGMQQSGGRRIKRTLCIDAGSIGFLDEHEIARLSKLHLLAPYLSEKQRAIAEANAALGVAAGVPGNTRRLTNIGTFRAYALAYLKAHPSIHEGMTCMVRSLAPSATGIPVELYCFTNTTVWAEYERVQGDVFDHLLAILPEFGLRLYQNPAGADPVRWQAQRAA